MKLYIHKYLYGHATNYRNVIIIMIAAQERRTRRTRGFVNILKQFYAHFPTVFFIAVNALGRFEIHGNLQIISYLYGPC